MLSPTEIKGREHEVDLIIIGTDYDFAQEIYETLLDLSVDKEKTRFLHQMVNEFPHEKYIAGRKYGSIGLFGYMPWEQEYFSGLYKQVHKNTMVDITRCYELYMLVQQSAKCAEGDLLEVGVWRGGTGALIATAASDAGLPSTVYLADTFAGCVKASEKDPQYCGGEHSDTSKEIVRKLISDMSLKNVEIIRGIYPDDCCEHFRDVKLRFVHIDVDIYQSSMDIFEDIWPRLAVGGIVVFDDYGCHTTGGITACCDELAQQHQDAIFTYNLNGHGIFVKIAK